MRYYSSSDEINFFEHNRFSDRNLPCYKDVAFLLGININSEPWNRLQDKKISCELWKKIFGITHFDYSLKRELPSLREQVFKKNSKYEEFLDKGKIYGFESYEYNGKVLEEVLKSVNIDTYSSMYEYFALGDNIGTCGFSSALMGVMFKDVKWNRGIIPAIAGTSNSENGSHAWIDVNHNENRIIIDTSLLLVIPEEYSIELGYVPTNTYTIEQKYDDDSFGDIYWEHYNVRSKQTTKNKASYEMYRRNRERAEKNTLVDIEDRNER